MTLPCLKTVSSGKTHSRSQAAQTPPGQSWFPRGSGLRCSSGRRTLVESPRAHVGTAALLQALLDCFSCHINNSSTSSQPALISPHIFLLLCCSLQSKYAKLCLLHTKWARTKDDDKPRGSATVDTTELLPTSLQRPTHVGTLDRPTTMTS